jgi:hypothetical protein
MIQSLVIKETVIDFSNIKGKAIEISLIWRKLLYAPAFIRPIPFPFRVFRSKFYWLLRDPSPVLHSQTTTQNFRNPNLIINWKTYLTPLLNAIFQFSFAPIYQKPFSFSSVPNAFGFRRFLWYGRSTFE